MREGYSGRRFCVSVKSHLTSGASVRPENAVTGSPGNEGKNICGVFSATPPLPRSSALRSLWWPVGHFSCGLRMRIVHKVHAPIMGEWVL